MEYRLTDAELNKAVDDYIKWAVKENHEGITAGRAIADAASKKAHDAFVARLKQKRDEHKKIANLKPFAKDKTDELAIRIAEFAVGLYDELLKEIGGGLRWNYDRLTKRYE